MNRGDFSSGDGGGESMRYGLEMVIITLRGGLDLGVREEEKKPILD